MTTDADILRRIADDSDLRKWSDDAETLRAIADRLDAIDSTFVDPDPWFRYCDSEMPGAPSWERYATESNGTEYRPRTKAEWSRQNGAVRA